MHATAEICVVRHGETDWNVQGILQGSIDVALNDNGRRQAEQLAQQFAACAFDGIHSSPLSRARETAEIIAGILALPAPILEDSLRERYFGSVQGVPKAELAASHPELLRQIVERDPCAHFADGEALEHCAERIIAGLGHIAASRLGQRVLLITHGWVMDVITRHAFGVPPTTTLPLKRKNGEALWLACDGKTLREMAAPATWKQEIIDELTWTDALRIGVTEIDSQHRQLIAIRNRLAACGRVEADASLDEFRRILAELFDYASAHFQSEEAYMQSIGFPHLASQQDDHQAFIDMLHEYSQATAQGQDIRQHCLYFLTRWLLSHIGHSDMQIRHFLESRLG